MTTSIVWKQLAGAIVVLAISATSASADVFRPTRTDDPAPGGCTARDCSLREAVIAANANPRADRIVLRAGSPYRLSIPRTAAGGPEDGDLDVDGSLLIRGSGGRRPAIGAGRIDRVFDVVGGRLGIRHLRLRQGRSRPDAGGSGGAIRTTRRLEITRSSITESQASGDGGAIYAEGRRASVTLRRVELSENVAGGVGRGGAVATDGAQFVRIEESTIRGNGSDDGGGVYLDVLREYSVITGTTFERNNAPEGSGGALYVAEGSDVFVKNSTLAFNSASGGSDDPTHRGGGIYNAGGVSLNAVTVIGNIAFATGADKGGGIYTDGSMGIQNTLFARNQSDFGQTGSDCAGPSPVVSFGGNLLTETNGTPACSGFDARSDLIRPNPRVGALADWGGPTETVRLKRNSPAIDRAGRTTSPEQDQRGVGRDRRPDIGAFELR
jgi:predicted outer membrane repeat protein